MDQPCINIKNIRATADALYVSIPFPARYPPIPVDFIARNLQVSYHGSTARLHLFEEDLEMVDGMVKPLQHKEGIIFAVTLNSTTPKVRRRWTLAHEMAHVLLGHPWDWTKPEWVMDREADKLAREILIPRKWLAFNFKPGDERRKMWNGLAGEYNVSWEAMQLALREYGLADPGVGRCVHFPNVLECFLEEEKRRSCVEPPPECRRCSNEQRTKTAIKCKPFVVPGHPAFELLHIRTIEDLLGRAPLARLLEENLKSAGSFSD